jgi:hypothetical protein
MGYSFMLFVVVVGGIIRRLWPLAVVGALLVAVIGFITQASGGSFWTAVAYSGTGLGVIAVLALLLTALGAIKNGFK